MLDRWKCPYLFHSHPPQNLIGLNSKQPFHLSHDSVSSSRFGFAIFVYHIMAAVESVPSPAPNSTEEGTQKSPSMAGGPDISILTDLNDSRVDLLDRIQSLKNDLQDWRGRLDTQVKTYRQELGDLKNTLNDEVDQLKSEFQELRNSLLKQLDETSNITSLISDVPKKAEAEVSDS